MICSSTCGDLDYDLDVDGNDFSIFLSTYEQEIGSYLYDSCADYDGGGTVTIADYQKWKQCYRSYVGANSAIHPEVPLLGDYDADGDVDLHDFGYFTTCINGGPAEFALSCIMKFDFNDDQVIDLDDYSEFVDAETGPLEE